MMLRVCRRLIEFFLHRPQSALAVHELELAVALEVGGDSYSAAANLSLTRATALTSASTSLESLYT